MAQHRLFWAYRNETLGLKTDPEAARMWFEKAVNGDFEDEDEDEDKLARYYENFKLVAILVWAPLGWRRWSGSIAAATGVAAAPE